MDSTKKISFGFNKLNRKPIILINKEPAKEENSKVQLIEYLEEQSIKVIGDENNVPAGPLIIPMKTPNKKLINLVDIVKNDFKDTIEEVQEKTLDNTGTKTEEKALTLDELAAKELMNGTTNNNSKNDVTKVIEVPATDKVTFEGEKESSLDDYESIPVDQFGKAMLRGMGWQDGQGIGKNQQLVKMAQPVIRPKGMGLGADSITKKSAATAAAVDRNGKVLACVKGAYVKVIAGYHKGYYGQIMGFDDESGRFIIKLTLTNINVSLNEFLVAPVTKEEFNKNSKVLNHAKYEEYLKNKEQKANLKHGDEKQVKKEVEESNSDAWSDVKVKKEPNASSNDERTSHKVDYDTVKVKKETDSAEEDTRRREQRSQSYEEQTRKYRDSKHKSKERSRKEKADPAKERKKNDHGRRYGENASEPEDNRRINKDKYDSNEEYSTSKTSRRNADKYDTRKGKRSTRKDKHNDHSEQEHENKHERRAHSSREQRKESSRYSDSETEDKKRSGKAKRRDNDSSEEDREKYERKSRKQSRHKRYDASESDSDAKNDKKSHKKEKYRDRSTQDKRR